MLHKTIGDLEVTCQAYGVPSDESTFSATVAHKHGLTGFQNMRLEQIRDLHYALGRVIDDTERQIADYIRRSKRA